MTEKLDALEAKITRLKQEYEQYFMRLLKREPLIHKKEVEGLIMRYTNMTINNTADQFKLNCLLSRFNSYRQYWTRTLRAMEDGVYVRRAESYGSGSAVSVAAKSAGQGAWQAKEAAVENLTPLYNEFVAARKRCETGTKGLSEEKFRASIERARERIEKTYNVTETEVSVIEKDGKVKLAIRPKGVKVR